jgi:hypothetical protein
VKLHGTSPWHLERVSLVPGSGSVKLHEVRGILWS